MFFCNERLISAMVLFDAVVRLAKRNVALGQALRLKFQRLGWWKKTNQATQDA